jgi:DNA-binding LytR/AlgR family response regulator
MIKTIIVDDEELARERMRELLKEHPDLEIIDEAADGISAIEKIEELQPELVFLDIEMPGCSGIDVVRSITTGSLPKIVFCTAYDQYAVQAFELNAVDYLLKPVTRARLAESLKRIKEAVLTKNEFQKRLEAVAGSLRQASPKFMTRFLGRRGKKIYLINEAEVIYFKVDRNLVFIVTDAGEYWTNYTLAQIEDAVDPSVFFRTHRQSLVNLNRIKELSPLIGGSYMLTMSNSQQVEVSRRQASKLLEILK